LTRRARFATTAAMTLSVVAVDRLEFAVETRSWPFASERRAEIDAHFAGRNSGKAQLWNGRVLLARDCRFADNALTGICFETDYASFLAWRDWGFPDPEIVNCFAMGALKSCDGAFLLGVMAPHTANAGAVYFAAGTPDPNDIVDGRVDLAGSVTREVAEETGLTGADYAVAAGWHAVPAGPRLALMKTLTAPMPADMLQRKMRDHLARETKPELSDIRIVRGPGDFDRAMPAFVTAYLDHCFRQPAS
jgi:8-oxo-dGTP pyrophosphatase MutT (NUDIX family)